MNLSLRKRVAFSFIVANLVVLVLSFTVFLYLDSLNNEISSISDQTFTLNSLTDEIRISAVSILKYQRRLIARKNNPQLIEKITNLCEVFESQLQRLDPYFKDPKVKKVIANMESYVSSLKIVVSKATFIRGAGMSSVSELADKILDSYTEFQEIQKYHTSERDSEIKDIIKDTKKNMMITLIIGFLGTIILGLIIPGKIALPFKKINDTIRELQDCNFDVSIFYNQEDEIGEIATEMNKMIQNIKHFEELRQDRISVELRKFDALANLVKRPVLVANAAGKLIYMNNKLYSLLEVESDDVLHKDMRETSLPESIMSAYELAIKRRSKIENQKVTIPHKVREKNGGETKEDPAKEEVANGDAEPHEAQVGEDKQEKPVEHLFEGYANVIPIRGKESSLDYYLMVLSREVFA